MTASLIALFSLTIFFKVGKITLELPTNRVLGGFLFEAFFALAVYATVHVFAIRARDIETLKPADTYAISVLILLLRLGGEAYCAFVTLMAIGGGLFVWFTNQGLGDVLGSLLRALFPVLGDDSSFMGGIELHLGKISEMATGEGKTLVATLPLYLNALPGKGAHLTDPGQAASR